MRLYGYILREIFGILLVGLFVFTSILILNRFSKLTELILEKGVSLKDILLLFVYSSPSQLTFSLPMSFLLATVIVLGRLSSENEILALKACGIDLRHLFVPVSFMALLIVGFGLFNTSYLLAKSTDGAELTLLEIMKKSVSFDEKEGIFHDTIPGVVIYVDRIRREEGVLEGILISDKRDPKVPQLILAKRGGIRFDPSTLILHFNLEKGSLHRWEKAKDAYRMFSFENYAFSLNLSSLLNTARLVRKKPFEMSYKELKEKIEKARGAEKEELLFELYKKLSISLSPLPFTLLLVPLGIRRRTGGKFSGLLYGLSLFLLYYILLAFSERIRNAFGLPPFLMSSLPNGTVALLGLFLSRGLNEERDDRLEGIKRVLGL
jgi:lipopolysaccharide export system permease protein